MEETATRMTRLAVASKIGGLVVFVLAACTHDDVRGVITLLEQMGDRW